MTEVNEEIRISLVARDEASAAIEKVTESLRKLGALQLGSLASQVQALAPGLEASVAAARELGTALQQAGSAADTLSSATERLATGMRVATSEARNLSGAFDAAGQAASSVGDRAAEASASVGRAVAEQTASVETGLRTQEQAIADHYNRVEDSLRQSLQRQNALITASVSARTALSGAGVGAAMVPYGGRAVEPSEALPYATITETTPPRLDVAPLQESMAVIYESVGGADMAIKQLSGALESAGANVASMTAAMRAIASVSPTGGGVLPTGETPMDAARRLTDVYEAEMHRATGGGAGGFGGFGGGGFGGGGAGAAGAGGTAGGVNPFEQMVELVRNAMAAMVEATRTAMSEVAQAARTGFSQVEQAARSAVPGLSAHARGGGEADGALSRVVGERGLLGEKGPVGGPMDVPGLGLAEQFVVWGSVFSLYSQATQAVSGMTKELFTSNASFEEVGATLSAIYGGSGPAQQALAWMDKFAETTPFTRDQVRQAGIAFAAQGDDITGALTAAGNLSAAMHNTGGIMVATQGIVDAQNNQFRILRDQLHVTTAELEPFGLKMEKSGHVISATVLPAIQAFVAHNFSGAMAEQMKTLPGMFSNLQDIVTEGLRHAGAGAYDAVKSWFGPVMDSISDTVKKGLPAGAGLAGDTGGLLTLFADTAGRGLGQMASGGLRDLDAWVSKLGGAAGVIILVQRAWIEFTGALRTAWSVVEGVGDAIGQVWHDLGDAAGVIGTILSPVKAFFDVFRAGHDNLREVISVIGTLYLELKLLATGYDLVKGVAERFTGLFGGENAAITANTAAIEANTAALQGNATAAGGASAGRGARGVPAVPGGIGPALPADMVSTATVAGETFLGTLGRMGGAFYAAAGPMVAFMADLYLLPKAFDAASEAWRTAAGEDVKGAQPDVASRLRIPNGAYQSTIGASGAGEIQLQGPLAFAHFLQTQVSSEAYHAFGKYYGVKGEGFLGHGGGDVGGYKGSPAEFIAYLQQHPDQAARIAAEYGRQGGQGGAGYITSLVQGTAPGLTPQQAANAYTMFNQAVAQTQRDAASKLLSTSLPGDVNAQIEAYGARYRADHAGATDQQVAAAIDRYGIPLYKQYGLPEPAQIGKPRGGATGPTQDVLDAAAQVAQQQVGWDEALKVPYAQFKKDMDAATKAMTAAGDPADEVRAFYKEHTDAWARATAQLAQNQLAADQALQKPFDQVSADFDKLAQALAAEGDSSDEIAAKLGQAVDQYFSGVISQIESQRQALITVGAPVGQQLATVADQQDQMRKDNAQRIARGLKPKFTPEQIEAAGIAGQRQVLGPIEQQQVSSLTAGYEAAIAGGQITRLSQIGGYVQPIMAAEGALPRQPGESPQQQSQRLHLEQLRLIREGQDAVLHNAQEHLTFDMAQGASALQLQRDEKDVLAVIAVESGTNSWAYKLAKQQYDRQTDQHILDQLRKQFDWDTGPGGNAAQAIKDENAFLKQYAHEPGVSPLDVKLMHRQLDAQRLGSIQVPPEPAYKPFPAMGREPGFGAVDVMFGTPMTSALFGMVQSLRQMLEFWRTRALHDEQLLAHARNTDNNTRSTAQGVAKLIHLPPFPSGAAGPTNTVPGVRAGGHSLPITT